MGRLKTVRIRSSSHFLQKNADLVCHSFSKLSLCLWNQVNAVDALGRDEFAGIQKRQALWI
jgi:hypothetical protein